MKIFQVSANMKKSLKFRLTAVTLSVLTVSLAIVVIISSMTSSRFLTEDAKENLAEITEHTRDTLDAFLIERVKQLQSIADQPSTQTYLNSKRQGEFVRQLLQTHFQTYKNGENIFLVGNEGTIVMDGNQNVSAGLDIKSYSFWKLASNNKPFHIDEYVYRSPVTKKLVLVLAVPIRTGGTTSGIVCLALDWELFVDNVVNKIRFGETGYMTIIDGAFKIVSHPSEKMMMYDAKKLEFLQAVREKGKGFQRFHFGEEWKEMNWQSSRNSPMIVAGVINESDFLSELRIARFVIITISVICLGIGIITLLRFANRIVKPIILLTEGASRLSTGDIDLDGMDFSEIEALNKREDELGEIGKAYGQLIDYMKEKVQLASEIAAGDLTVEASISSDRDQLGQALSTMVDQLSTIVGEIRSAAGNITSGSEELAASSQSMSQGATEQASSIEEITSSTNEIASQIKQNAENSEQANALTEEAGIAAKQGNNSMVELVQAMGDITESSQNITRIIKTIDEIAFQINLLSLNAAVEAARAGKYGKGFAVVAEEVRNLATRSANAAKDIAEMIDGSVQQVGVGNEKAEKTAEVLTAIVEQIEKISDLNGEIAAASREQATGAGEIVQGLDQIDQVTQQNSAHAEESAAASEELSSQAMAMRDLINTFKVSAGGLSVQESPHTMTNGYQLSLQEEAAYGATTFIEQ